MGSAIAERLLGVGERVVVWNRTPDRATPLLELGAVRAETPVEAAVGADVAITALTDTSALHAVARPQGLASLKGRDLVVVDMSTVGPAGIFEFRRLLPESIRLVDAPIVGGPSQLRRGCARLLVGGDEPHIESVLQLLSALGSIRRCGALGSGAAVKVILNTALITTIAVLGETLALAQPLGVDRVLAANALAESALGAVVARANDPSGDFPLSLVLKDLEIALATAPEGQLPLAAHVARLLRGAIRSGIDQEDLRFLGRPRLAE